MPKHGEEYEVKFFLGKVFKGVFNLQTMRFESGNSFVEYKIVDIYKPTGGGND